MAKAIRSGSGGVGLPSWKFSFSSRRVSLALPFKNVVFGFSFSWLRVGLSSFGWELVLSCSCGGWPFFLGVWVLALPSRGVGVFGGGWPFLLA